MKCSKCNSEINDTAKFCPKCGEKIIAQTESNDSVTEDHGEQWYCLVMQNGNYQKMGPFGLEQLKVMLKNGQIDRSSQVWKEGLEEWMPIAKTELFQQLNLNQVAPPVQSNVSNTWVWILAFAPLISLVIYQVIGQYYLASKIRDGSLFTDYSSIVSTL